jgi:hypothetical protein
MAGGKKTGAKKTVGRARKGDTPKMLMRLQYVEKAPGVFVPRYERVDLTPAAPAGEAAAE